jgi:hypothetical protein
VNPIDWTVQPNSKSQNKHPLDLLNGILATDTFYSDMELTDFGIKLKDTVNSMGISKQEIISYHMLGMEAYGLLTLAMNQCSVPAKIRICINDKIRSTYKFEGIMGFISIDAEGKTHRPLVISRLSHGKFMILVKVF